MDVFVSVGTGLSTQQEAFVSAIEERLRAVGLTPRTIGRNTFSADAPLQAVTELMNQCGGAVVIALERFHFPRGEERRGSPRHETLTDVRTSTPWNQIEAAMAYQAGLPLLVIVDPGLRKDGLLEHGNDWYVQELEVAPESLNSTAFLGILDSWRKRLVDPVARRTQRRAKSDPASMTIGELVVSLKPSQIWATLVALVAALATAFALGANLLG